jgi:hypothetical protein
MSEGNENLVYYPVEIQEFFYMPYSLTTWELRLYFPSERKVCCGFLSPLKSIALAEFEPANFGSSSKHTNHYTTKATEARYLSIIHFLRGIT